MAQTYPTVFQTPTPSEGSSTPWGSFAQQLDPFNLRYQTPDQWESPSVTSVSYDPASTYSPPTIFDYGTSQKDDNGLYYDPDYGASTGFDYGAYSVDYGANVINAVIQQNLQYTHPELYSGFDSYGTTSNPGVVTTLGGVWSGVDAWDSKIISDAQKVATATGVYVPPNLIKAIMRLESGGDQNAIAKTPTGATEAIGEMQINPGVWTSNPWGLDPTNADDNLLLGVYILAGNYNQGSPPDPTTGQVTKSWEWAAKRYLGIGTDDTGETDNAYWDTVSGYWQQLSNAQPSPTGATQFTSIWGGFDAPLVTQFGSSSAGSAVGLAYGTRLYAPSAGKITIIGSADGKTFDFANEDSSGNPINSLSSGELAIKLTNGDVYILGNMSQIVKADGTPFKVGDTVNAGDFLGFSGSTGGGVDAQNKAIPQQNKVYIEYDKLQSDGSFTATDPSTSFAAPFTGTFGTTTASGPTAAVGANSSWADFMHAAATGAPLSNAQPNDADFHSWLLGQMPGHAPTVLDTQSGNPTWVWSGGTQGTVAGGGSGTVAAGGGAGVVAGVGGVGRTGTSAKMVSLFGAGAVVDDWGAWNVPSGNGLYDYGKYYGMNQDGLNHTGDDVVIPYGTPLRAAFSGTVICAGTGVGSDEAGGGCAAFEDTMGPGSGRIEILSDDGQTAMIYGHTSADTYPPGTKVTAGEVIGLSGGENSAHVHIEVRVKDATTDYGWRIVDPMDYIS